MITPEGIRLFVQATPKAAQNRFGPILTGPPQARLKISVTAVPENGKANSAIVQYIAKVWKIPKGAIEITAGSTDRNKVLWIKGSPDQYPKLETWLKTASMQVP